MGQPVIVENRSGAGTSLGSELVAKAAPNSHAILSAGIANMVGPALYDAKLTYDPILDLVWITNVAKVPVMLVAHPSFPVRNVKAKPGSVVYASSGIATPGHLAGKLFKGVAGVNKTFRTKARPTRSSTTSPTDASVFRSHGVLHTARQAVHNRRDDIEARICCTRLFDARRAGSEGLRDRDEVLVGRARSADFVGDTPEELTEFVKAEIAK